VELNGCFRCVVAISKIFPEWQLWVASRRWAATDGFRRLNGGRRPGAALEDECQGRRLKRQSGHSRRQPLRPDLLHFVDLLGTMQARFSKGAERCNLMDLTRS
jgi:hypothetical protein